MKRSYHLRTRTGRAKLPSAEKEEQSGQQHQDHRQEGGHHHNLAEGMWGFWGPVECSEILRTSSPGLGRLLGARGEYWVRPSLESLSRCNHNTQNLHWWPLWIIMVISSVHSRRNIYLMSRVLWMWNLAWFLKISYFVDPASKLFIFCHFCIWAGKCCGNRHITEMQKSVLVFSVPGFRTNICRFEGKRRCFSEF